MSCSLLGLLAVGLAALSGCLRSHKPEVSAPEVKPQAQQTYSAAEASPSRVAPVPGASDTDVKNNSQAPAAPSGGDNCGPYPGYPCGTRYYTVSRSDFFCAL